MFCQEFDARDHGILVVLGQLLPLPPKLVRVLNLPRHEFSIFLLRNHCNGLAPLLSSANLPRPATPAGPRLPGVSSTGVGISHSDPDLAALQETANAGRAEISRAMARTVATTNGRAGSRQVGRSCVKERMAYFTSRACAVNAPGLRNTLR